jgi:hypothetical protein
LIEMIAMIGSPAVRGAVASLVCAGARACLAMAPVAGTATAASAASITATVPCAAVNRIAIPFPYLKDTPIHTSIRSGLRFTKG